MTRQISILKVKEKFIDEINKSRALVIEMRRLQKDKVFSSQGKYRYVEQVIGLAFSSVVSAWEDFLAAAMLRYMTGRIIPAVPVKTKIHGIQNLDIAFRILIGSKQFKSIRISYIDYNSLKKLKQDADIFLTNHPFSYNQEDEKLIDSMNKIRNRVAHSSQKCIDDFKDVAIQYFQSPNKKLKQGLSVGKLLMEKNNGNFFPNGLFSVNQLSIFYNNLRTPPSLFIGDCVFEIYLANLEELANRFIPF